MNFSEVQDITFEKKYKASELKQIGYQMTECIDAIQQIEEAKKAANSDYAKQIKSKEAELSNLSTKYKDGGETVQETAKKVENKEEGKIYWVNPDNEEEVYRVDIAAPGYQWQVDFPDRPQTEDIDYEEVGDLKKMLEAPSEDEGNEVLDAIEEAETED